ncbi:hypothetical protein BJX63DRAFT_380873 [Aspergillus granulosus]|uniref:GRHL1/CP2 C-terminal domain-containing protein n=1 Tax=Aspergillus granulosus TaxID=176169 RepID=A0ABR4HWT4_9EURO
MEKRKVCGSVSQPDCLRLKASRQSTIIQHRPLVPSLRRPAACFYIQFPGNDYHRAIYVAERTICELRDQISRKVQIRTRHIFHRKAAGLNMLADDEFVRQISDGQDMVAEFLNSSNVARDIDVVLTIKGI